MRRRPPKLAICLRSHLLYQGVCEESIFEHLLILQTFVLTNHSANQTCTPKYNGKATHFTFPYRILATDSAMGMHPSTYSKWELTCNSSHILDYMLLHNLMPWLAIHNNFSMTNQYNGGICLILWTVIGLIFDSVSVKREWKMSLWLRMNHILPCELWFTKICWRWIVIDAFLFHRNH